MTVVRVTRPDKTQPFRWRTGHGYPQCWIERMAQHTWLLVPYIAVIVTVVLILMLRGK